MFLSRFLQPLPHARVRLCRTLCLLLVRKDSCRSCPRILDCWACETHSIRSSQFSAVPDFFVGSTLQRGVGRGRCPVITVVWGVGEKGEYVRRPENMLLAQCAGTDFSIFMVHGDKGEA